MWNIKRRIKELPIRTKILNGLFVFMQTPHRWSSLSSATKGVPQHEQIGLLMNLMLSKHLWQNLPSSAPCAQIGQIGGRIRFKNAFIIISIQTSAYFSIDN